MRITIGKIAVAVGAGLLMATSALQASSITLTTSVDATLFNGGGVNSSLSVPGMFVGTDSGSVPKRGLIEFPIAGSIPAGSTITGATLTMTVAMVAGSSGSSVTNFGPLRTFGLYDEPQAWGASTNFVGASTFNGHGQGSPANPGDATWNDASYNANSLLATPWNIGTGGKYTSSSIDLADAANIPGTDGLQVSWSSSLLASEVQNWLNNPSSNNGLLVKNADEAGMQTFLGFLGEQGAINAGTPSAEPSLVVTFTPEPLGLP